MNPIILEKAIYIMEKMNNDAYSFIDYYLYDRIFSPYYFNSIEGLYVPKFSYQETFNNIPRLGLITGRGKTSVIFEFIRKLMDQPIESHPLRMLFLLKPNALKAWKKFINYHYPAIWPMCMFLHLQDSFELDQDKSLFFISMCDAVDAPIMLYQRMEEGARSCKNGVFDAVFLCTPIKGFDIMKTRCCWLLAAENYNFSLKDFGIVGNINKNYLNRYIINL